MEQTDNSQVGFQMNLFSGLIIVVNSLNERSLQATRPVTLLSPRFSLPGRT